MTKREQMKCAEKAKSIYDYSDICELGDCYRRYSIEKSRAFQKIREEMHSIGGQDLRIISHNCNIFTCGYIYAERETGVLKFVYHTPTYRVEIDY